jgi:FkbM family methyltransferase
MKKLINSLLALFGVALVRKETLEFFENKSKQGKLITSKAAKNQLIGNAFELLKNEGFNPKHILDIGANHGAWSRQVYGYFPQANYTMIEPQENLKFRFADLLEKPQFHYLPIGVGEHPGHFNLTITERDDSCNFRMTEEEALQQGLKQIQVQVDTIDHVVAQSAFGIPQLIKIDAEGLDLQVLKGATSVLGKTEVILIEAAVTNPSFDNSALAVMNAMDGYGYKLFDITDLNRPFENRTLWLVELMFVLKGGKLDSRNWTE